MTNQMTDEQVYILLDMGMQLEGLQHSVKSFMENSPPERPENASLIASIRQQIDEVSTMVDDLSASLG